MNTVTVPQGQRVHLTLSDGTKVWLNAKTKMEYPQSFKVSDQRIVSLTIMKVVPLPLHKK